MARFVLQRFSSTVLMLALLSIVAFVIIELPPGDCAERHAFESRTASVLRNRTGKQASMTLGMPRSVLALVGIAFSGCYLSLLFFVGLSSLARALFSPAALALISNTLPPHLQAQASGSVEYGKTLGWLSDQPWGFICSAWGPQATFLLGTLAPALGATVCFSLPSGKATENPWSP